MSKRTKEKFALPELMSKKDYYDKTEVAYSVNSNQVKELISSSKHKKVLLVFFAHWCIPCHESMPDLRSFYLQKRDEIEIIFISSVDWLEVNSDRKMLNKYDFASHPMLSINMEPSS
ncbi:TlpA family protein disulfide reductase [Marinifilum caeruleilacunae]|nr:thioredoxin-like domain-containing protein [Marinifilum caeruleilacunae]